MAASIFIADGGAAASRRSEAAAAPGAIFVDKTGQRFCNESNSYVEVGKAMYANKAVPCWLVFDEGYVGRYVSASNPFEAPPARRGHRQGRDHAGDTIEDLARQIGVPGRAWSRR